MIPFFSLQNLHVCICGVTTIHVNVGWVDTGTAVLTNGLAEDRTTAQTGTGEYRGKKENRGGFMRTLSEHYHIPLTSPTSMEKNGDSLLPYLGFEGIFGSSHRACTSSRQPEAPATKAPALQLKRISHEIGFPPVVTVEGRRSQFPKEPLKPEDIRHDMLHRKQGLFTEHHSRVRCPFCASLRLSPITRLGAHTYP